MICIVISQKSFIASRTDIAEEEDNVMPSKPPTGEPGEPTTSTLVPLEPADPDPTESAVPEHPFVNGDEMSYPVIGWILCVLFNTRYDDYNSL